MSFKWTRKRASLCSVFLGETKNCNFCLVDFGSGTMHDKRSIM